MFLKHVLHDLFGASSARSSATDIPSGDRGGLEGLRGIEERGPGADPGGGKYSAHSRLPEAIAFLDALRWTATVFFAGGHRFLLPFWGFAVYCTIQNGEKHAASIFLHRSITDVAEFWTSCVRLILREIL